MTRLGMFILGLAMVATVGIAWASVLGDSTGGMGDWGNTGGLNNPAQARTWPSTNGYSYLNGYNAPPVTGSANADLPASAHPRFRQASTLAGTEHSPGVRWQAIQAYLSRHSVGFDTP